MRKFSFILVVELKEKTIDMIKNILFPTDFSENSAKAIKFVTAIASKTNAKVHLLHAFGRGSRIPAMQDMSYEMAHDEAEKKLHKIREKFGDYVGGENIEFGNHLIFDNSAIDAIENSVEKYDIDFVVMGTKGATGLSEVLFGSNTLNVIRNIDVPIMTVPEETPSQLAYERIVLATDFRSIPEKSINFLRTFNNIFDSEIIILHVKDREDEPPNEAFIEEFKSEMKDFEVSFDSVFEKDISLAIGEYTKSADGWLIGLGQKQRNWFERVIEDSNIEILSLYINLPLLIFPMDE